MNEMLGTLIPLIGTAIGTFGGIIASAKLTNYRIEQLEKKVDKHNNFAARMPVVEEKLTMTEKQIDAINKTVAVIGRRN